MTREEKLETFGVPVVPLVVPLAPGESPDQYEERFLDLRDQNRGNDKKERALRTEFAVLNAKGVARFDPTRTKKRSMEKGDDGASSLGSCDVENEDYGMRDAVQPDTKRAAAPKSEIDVEVEQLQQAYDDLNEQIILNQRALDASILQLTQHSLNEVEEKTRIEPEHEEMGAILHEEWDNRRRIVAKLVLDQWRHDRRGLEAWATDTTTTDDEAMQRACHDACLELSSEIAMLNERCAQLLQEMDEDVTTASEALARAQRQVRERHDQQVRQYGLLTHTDKRLRQHLLELLQRAAA